MSHPFTWRQAVLLLLCAAVLGWSVLQISAIPPQLQYLLPAPQSAAVPLSSDEEEKEPAPPNAWITDWQTRLKDRAADEWTGIISDCR